MFDIEVKKIDDVHIKVLADLNIREQIHETFRFRVPNYQFTPKYKAGWWDGYIKLYNMYDCQIYGGLLKEIVGFAKRRGHSIHVDPVLLGYEKTSVDDVEDWIKNELQPKLDDGSPLTPRDYQLDALIKSIKFRRVLLESATNSGKSFIIYSILNWLFHHGKINAALIVVPTVSLVHQMYGDFEDYAQNTGFDVDEWVHKIHAGQKKWSDKPIIISTWQSIYEMEPEWFAQYDCIIGDEAHGAETKSMIGILESMKNCPYKIGMTGSLKSFEGSLLTLQGLFGPRIKVIRAHEMIDRGYSTELNIQGIMMEYPTEECQALAKVQRDTVKELKESGQNSAGTEYRLEMEYIINHKGRDTFLKNLIRTRKGNTLVLYRYVKKHGLPLYQDIKQMVGDDRKVFFVSGDVDPKVRDQIRHITEKSDNAIIIASYKTFSTGINIKRLHNLILAFPTKAKIKIVQSLGRMLRKHKSKDVATVFDLCDDLQWKTKVNYAKKHFLKRLQIYRDEKHKYKIQKVQLKPHE